VDDDGEGDFKKIQDAIDNANDGDTIRVWDGVYYENIIVNRTIEIIGNGSENSVIEGDGNATVVVLTKDRISISGFKIIGGWRKGNTLHYPGLAVVSNFNIISRINCSGNDYGIWLFKSENNRIEDNICSSNRYDGIYLWSECNNNTLTNNTLSLNGQDGIRLFYSKNCSINNNTCVSNSDNGIVITYFSTNCSLVGNSLISNKNNGISGVDANNCTITKNNISSNREDGVQLYYSNGCTIADNTCANNFWGLHISNSVDWIISNNECENNLIGIRIAVFDNASIINNICMSNNIGINISSASAIIIKNNSCVSNFESGIELWLSSTCEIENTICENNSIGIHIEESENCTIRDCTIKGNRVGILVESNSRDNNANYNNIVDNSNFSVNAINNNNFTIDARYNWWGNEGGPNHDLSNGKEGGENLTDFVIFEPWLDERGNLVYILEDTEKNSTEADDDNYDYTVPLAITGILGMSLLGLILYRQDLRFALLSFLPLYTKLEKDDIMSQSTRHDIYSYVSNEPGSNYSTIKKRLNIGTSSLVYHLNVLQREGYIRSKKEMGHRFFFPKDARLTAPPTTPALPPSPIQERIIEYLKENGPKTRTEIKDALSLKQQTVSYSIKSLERRGMVKTSGRGKNDVCETINR